MLPASAWKQWDPLLPDDRVGKIGDLPVQLDTQVVLLAAAFSICTGLFFGYYPARKASLLDPIEALRSQ